MTNKAAILLSTLLLLAATHAGAQGSEFDESRSQSITAYIRDAYGNLTDETWTILDIGISSERHASYTLDHHGNWTTLEEGGETYRRTIIYPDRNVSL